MLISVNVTSRVITHEPLLYRRTSSNVGERSAAWGGGGGGSLRDCKRAPDGPCFLVKKPNPFTGGRIVSKSVKKGEVRGK